MDPERPSGSGSRLDYLFGLKVKIGILLPSREALIAGRPDPLSLVEMAERAEELGFDSVWVGDSLFKSARFEPLTLLAAVAARTKRVTIGTAILIAPLRHPVLLAHSVATLDRVTGGRLILGLGSGWIEEEFKAVGVPYGERVGRLAETIRCCRALWSGQTEFEGKYFKLRDVDLQPHPQQEGGPPIWVGGSGPRSLRVAGRLGNGWFPTPPNVEAFTTGWEALRAQAKDSERDPNDLTGAAYLTINLDPKEGPQEIRHFAQDYYGLPYEIMEQVQGYFAGDADACLDWIRGFMDAGASHIVLRFGATDSHRHLERVAQHVLPALSR